MKSIFIALVACVFLLASCEKDNFDAPKSKLTGKVMYDGQALGLRSGGVQLELWQHGYALFNKIPVHVDQDGTFSAEVFDGDYKLTLIRGNGPWADNTDSLDVKVNGSAVVDVEVDPYFVVNDVSFQANGSALTATFTLDHVNTARTLERVVLYIGQTVIVDNVNNVMSAERPASAVNLAEPITLTATIPASLVSKGYAFARIGVKTSGVGEFLFSQPQKIEIN